MPLTQPSVLIVDADPKVAESIQQTLARRGMKTVVAGSAEEGLQHLETPFDVVLLDLELPGVSGHALLKALRERGQHDVPVIITSGKGTIDDVIEALRNRASDYLRKPFFPEQLISAIDRALAPRPHLRPAGVGVGVAAAQGNPLVDGLLTDAERQAISIREKEVLRLLMQGRRAPEMAAALKISPHTVRNHLKAIYQKLGVHSQGALAEFLLARRDQRP
ncbi:MAG: response regulator transcription factor [Myxococcales bacterium]|nr:response regulator transcription factor [Myxococcales bacterium]